MRTLARSVVPFLRLHGSACTKEVTKAPNLESMNNRKPVFITSGLLGLLTIQFISYGQVATVNQSGSGNFTNIQAAIDSGASTIVITDSGHYVENLEIGSPTGLGGDPLNG